MKREKFLMALTGMHHEALLVCQNIETACAIIRGDGMGHALEDLTEKVGYFFNKRLKPHLKAEEKITKALGPHSNAKKEDIQRLFTEHGRLKALLREGSLESLETFSKELKAHVQFEEWELFPLLEKNLTAEEKQAAALELEKTLAPSLPLKAKKW